MLAADSELRPMRFLWGVHPLCIVSQLSDLRAGLTARRVGSGIPGGPPKPERQHEEKTNRVVTALRRGVAQTLEDRAACELQAGGAVGAAGRSTRSGGTRAGADSRTGGRRAGNSRWQEESAPACEDVFHRGRHPGCPDASRAFAEPERSGARKAFCPSRRFEAGLTES